jgi:hypothetical protein
MAAARQRKAGDPLAPITCRWLKLPAPGTVPPPLAYGGCAVDEAAQEVSEDKMVQGEST